MTYVFTRSLALSLLLAASFGLSAQQTLHVVDAASGAPLPYATVVNRTQAAIYYADAQGTLRLAWAGTDTIQVTFVGYEDRHLAFGSVGDTIRLTRRPSMLQDVVVRGCKTPDEFRYENSDSVIVRNVFEGVTWQPNLVGVKIGVLAPPPVRPARLSQLEFTLTKAHGAPKGFPTAPVRLTFYAVDAATQLPAEPFDIDAVIYHPKKIGKQRLILDSLAIPVPASGFYVGIEILANPEDCYLMTMRDSLGQELYTYLQYGLMFDGVRSRDFPIAFYNKVRDNWEWAGVKYGRTGREPGKAYGTLRFAVVYKACKL